MGIGEQRPPGEGNGVRRVVYCLIPYELAPRIHDALRRHFRESPHIEVVVEQRHRERRSGGERRATQQGHREDRRRIRSPSGRRAGERRAPQMGIEPPPLPRRLRRYADRITFVERIEPAGEELEDRDTARLVARFQAGDRQAFTDVYRRYFDRVYRYLRVALRDSHEAEDVAQQVFIKLLENLPRYERRRQPFRSWLFVIARNCAVDSMRRRRDVEIANGDELDSALDASADHEESLLALEWISDPDLMLFVERLPAAQRQVLVLRYMLDMSPADTARALEISQNHVRVLQHRALRFLGERLRAIGRSPKRTRRSRSRRCAPQAPVLRSRRWALM